MKTKLIGLLVCMLLIATTLVSATSLKKENMNTTSYIVDVPTWETGDSWIYNTHIYTAASPNVTDELVIDGRGELLLEVSDDTGEYYTLQGTMKSLVGTIEAPGAIGFHLTRFNSYESTIKIQKSNLSVIDHDSTLKAIVLLTLGPIPLPIPLQMQYRLITTFGPMWNLLPFPLTDGQTGEYDNITLQQEYDVTMFWGLIPVDNGINSEGWIGAAPYNCTLESVTVPAGTYDAYNVSCDLYFGLGHDWYLTYYSDEVGNIVKCAYNIDALTGNTYYLYEMELLSTTYIP